MTRITPPLDTAPKKLPEAAELRLDARSSVHPNALIGRGCDIGPYVFIDDLAVVGDHCRIEAGAHIARGTVIEEGVLIGANVAFAAPPTGSSVGAAVVKPGVCIGANATILAGLVIGDKAVIRPGAVILRSVPPAAIVEGNPASIVGYVDADQGTEWAMQRPGTRNKTDVELTPVKGVSLHYFPVIKDMRGDLIVGEFERQIPFKPLRYFLVLGVPSTEIRGAHAHRECHQFLICVRGKCAVVADDGLRRTEVALDAPNHGLYLPPMTWGIQYKYTADAMVLVFASHYYDPLDYIREYSEFIELIKSARVET